MREREKEKQQKIPNSILLSLLLLSLVLLTVQMLSRYITGGNGGSSARVAKFQVTSDLKEFQQTFSVNIKPGDTQQYTFQIENGSETALNLQMDVQCNGNLPVQISYSEEAVNQREAEITDLQAGIIIDNALDNSEGVWKGTMNSGSQVKKYTLIITWPTGRNGLTYAGGVSAVDLKIRAEQAD